MGIIFGNSKDIQSLSSFDLIFVDAGDGFKISGSASSGSFSVLGLERPSV